MSKWLAKNSPVLLVAALLAVVIFQPFAASASNPADKAVASGGTVVTVSGPGRDPGSITPTEDGTPILSTDIKTSAPEDLIFEVTLECSIITQLVNQGGPTVKESSSNAEGRIRVWITLDSPNDPNQGIVPIKSTSQNPQPHNPSNYGNDENGKVTFCNRFHEQELQDAESGGDGLDTLRTYERTKTANGFNWVFFNAGPGNHVVTVWADLYTNANDVDTHGTPDCEDTQIAAGPTACATGFVGNRMLIIEPDKFPNVTFT